MLSSVLSFEVSSGALSATYAAGSEVEGVSVEPVEGALEGVGEFLALFAEDSVKLEFMIAMHLKAEVYLKHRSSPELLLSNDPISRGVSLSRRLNG